MALIFLSQTASAELKVRWTSVAGIILEDESTTLVFDPAFTRPGLLSWLNFSRVYPDMEVIDENLTRLNLKKVDGVFVSHEHFDHAIDGPEIAHRFGAEIYGGESLGRIARANQKRSGWALSHFHEVKDRDSVTIGKFKIQFFRRSHAALFPKLGFRFLGGPVPENFDFNFDEYREGEVWCYVIEHPEGKILIDQGSHFFEGVKPFLDGVNVVLAGVANKKSAEDFVQTFVGEIHPEVLIPLHFDLFVTTPNREKTVYLPGVHLDQIQSLITKDYPSTKFIEPKWGEALFVGKLPPL